MQRPLALWIRLRSSLWFVPASVVVGSLALAHVLVEIGNYLPRLSQENLPAIFGFSAEGSRSVLSAIATAMITVAGVAFSITIVSLSLASSQYSPRVLRQFMRDRANQWVLGIFVGVFAYCLAVLPRVRGGEEAGFVPAVAVAFGVVYALAGVACLIFFIHHVANSIQASCVVCAIAAETRAAAVELFPEPRNSEQPDDDCANLPMMGVCRPIAAAASGYIQLVADRELLRVAAKHDVTVRMERGVGEFVVAGTRIVSVSGPGADSPELAADLNRTFTMSRTRTVEQDVMFGVRQIVDVALRALSPSLNDPTTATLCVDYLTTILHVLVSRRMGRALRWHEGRARVIGCEPDFATVLRAALGEIRAAAAAQPLVLQAIVRGAETLATVAVARQRRAALVREVAAIRDVLASGTPEPWRSEIRAAVDELLRSLAISAGEQVSSVQAP